MSSLGVSDPQSFIKKRWWAIVLALLLIVGFLKSDETLFAWTYFLGFLIAYCVIYSKHPGRDVTPAAWALIGICILYPIAFHSHFAAVAQAEADRATAARHAVDAQKAAAAHLAEIKAHEERLAWQKAHPAEYAAQRLQARQAAAATARAQANAERARRAEQNRKLAAANQQKRAEILHWWNGATGRLAFALVTVKYAQESLASGDASSASRFIQQGSTFASQAFTDVGNGGAPDGLDDAKEKLGIAAMKYQDAFEKMRQFMDDNKPSEGADVQSDMSDGNDYYSQAINITRQRFSDLGGDATNIQDLQAQGTSLKASLDTIMGR